MPAPHTHIDDRQTIRLLGRLLGDVIREQHGQAAYQLIEDIRQQVVGEYRAGGAEAPMDRLTGLPLEDILRLIRGFSIFSQLANIADDHVLRRETRAEGALARLKGEPGLSPPRVRAYLDNAAFVPVWLRMRSGGTAPSKACLGVSSQAIAFLRFPNISVARSRLSSSRASRSLSSGERRLPFFSRRSIVRRGPTARATSAIVLSVSRASARIALAGSPSATARTRARRGAWANLSRENALAMWHI